MRTIAFLLLLYIPYILLVKNALATKILLIGESNETQLMDLFQESKSSEFQIATAVVDHDQEDAEQNDTFCGYISSQVE